MYSFFKKVVKGVVKTFTAPLLVGATGCKLGAMAFLEFAIFTSRLSLFGPVGRQGSAVEEIGEEISSWWSRWWNW